MGLLTKTSTGTKKFIFIRETRTRRVFALLFRRRVLQRGVSGINTVTRHFSNIKIGTKNVRARGVTPGELS